jgi:HEAT repeat protein
VTKKRLLAILILAAVAGGCGGNTGPVLSGGKTVDEWVRALSDANPKLREKAAEKLGNAGSGDSAVISALCGALQDKDPGVRCQAILALVKCGSAAKPAVESLKVLERQDPDPRVRSFAAKALENLGP